jgi:hypothetical protein
MFGTSGPGSDFKVFVADIQQSKIDVAQISASSMNQAFLLGLSSSPLPPFSSQPNNSTRTGPALIAFIVAAGVVPGVALELS